MIDEQLFAELQELYRTNLTLFRMQNTGFFIDRVHPLRIEDVEKAVGFDGLVDKKYIDTHYVNFTVNPQPVEIMKGYTTRIEIAPDISWEVKKNNGTEEV